MKLSGNQKRLYLLAVILLLITLVLCAAWNGDDAPRESAPEATPTQTPGATEPPDAARAVAGAQTMSTVAYYQNDHGYLVPVMRTIKAEEGVAKATLKAMVKSVYNDMEAARMGLRTVIPENTTFDLDISGGVARIDLSKEALACADAAAESNMVNAIVHTLTAFPSVEKVSFLVDGKSVSKMKYGTSLKGEFTAGPINLESAAQAEDGHTVTLYFTGDAPSLIVPVTRVVYGQPDIETAVLELVKGPGATSPLENGIPSGCGLIGVEMDEGVAKLNFTREFIRIAEASDGGRLALKALALTCRQFEGVKRVEILVEGEAYDPGEGTLSMPTCANSASDIADAFIQTQSNQLFQFE